MPPHPNARPPGQPARHRSEPRRDSRSGESLRRDSSAGLRSALPDPLIFICLVVALVGAASAALQLTIVGVLVLTVVLFSRLWSRLSLEKVTLDRSFSRHCVFRGDEVQIDITLDNRKPLPLPWLKLSFVLPEGLTTGQAGGKAGDSHNLGPGRSIQGGVSFYESFSLGRYERVRAQRTVVARQRGCYRLSSAHLESGDLFGFYASRAESISRDQELVVFPVPRPLPEYALPARSPEGDLRGPATLHEDYSRPDGTREYRPGDPLRLMDWKTTARQRRPFVRTFEPSNGHQVMVLLECGTSDQLWRFRPERLEAAVAAAASVCALGIESGHQLGLVANGLPLRSGRPVVRPAAGQQQLQVLMHSLARVQPMPTWPLARLIQEQAGLLLMQSHHVTFVYVTAKVRADTVRLIEHRCRAGAVANCVFLGMEPPPSLDFMQVYDLTDVFSEELAPRSPRESVIYA